MKPSSLIPLFAFANDAALAPIVSYDRLRPGVIALANDDRLTTGTYSEALTEYITGWTDGADLEAALEYIAPSVPVARRFDFKQATNSEAYISEVDDERAIGSAFKRVVYTGTEVTQKTLNKGLTYRMDMDEEGGVITEEQITARLIKRLLRNEYRRAVTVLLAAATNAAKTWSSGTPNCDKDLRDAIARAQLSAGLFPNRGIIGLVPWNLRSDVFEASDKAGAFAGLNRTATEVGQKLGLDDLRVDRELYQSSKTVKTRIIAPAVVFHGESGVSKDDPSTCKRFVTPTGAGAMRVHREEVGAKFIDITVEHYSNIVGTSSVGAEKLTIS